MQCLEVVELLSAYYDGELPFDKSVAVREHVAVCSDCSAELETLHRLSDLAMKLDQPSPSRNVWPRIAAQLNSSPSPIAPTAVTVQRPFRKTLLAVVALLLVGLSWIAYTQLLVRNHQHLAVNFGHFLDTFEQSPNEAQQELVKHYSGQPIEIPAAIRELKYRPVVADGLPDGYEPTQAYLLKMPCCRCLEACYQRKDGGMVCVFEHEIDQPVWFGDRPASSKVCSGKPTRVVEVDSCLAATWQQQRHHITVIGAKDVDEVTLLVAHFDRHRRL